MTPTELSARVEMSIRSFLADHSVPTLLRETSDAARTSLIKDHFCKLGKSLGFHVSAAGCAAADDSEWLYDMVWATMENGLLVCEAMALESEWRKSQPVALGADIDTDFQKLVQARADLRVWICAIPNEEMAQQHIESCETQIRTFGGTLAGDIYIFFVFVWSNYSFKLKLYSAP